MSDSNGLSRRDAIRMIGVSTVAIGSLSGTAIAGQPNEWQAGSKREVQVLPQEAMLEPEIKRAEQVPGMKIEQLPSGKYRIEYNKKKLPSMSRSQLDEIKANRSERAENIRKEIKHNYKKAEVSIQSTSRNTVELTEGEFLRDPSTGDTDVEEGGVTLDSGGIDDRPEDNEAHASALAGAGWGGWTGIVQIGEKVSIEGDSTKNILCGYEYEQKSVISAGGNSSAAGEVRFKIINETTGEEQEIELYDESTSRIGFDYQNGTPSSDLTTFTFRPGENYIILLEVVSHIDVKGLGMASSRFGDQVPSPDYDVPPYVQWNEFMIGSP